jgi:HPt (histidine-containing phosphotransfer) domain-containing protein
MLEIFERDSAERLPKIRDAVAAGDAETIMAEAHALKGGSGTFFATTTFETANKLETMGRENELAEAAATFAELEEAVRNLTEAVRNIIKS